MEATRIEEIAKEAMETDNPQLMEQLDMNEKVTDDGWECESVREYLEDYSESISEGIIESIKANKVNMWKYFKENFPDNLSWEDYEVEIIKVEQHEVEYYSSGTATINAKDGFKVNEEGKLVLDMDAIDENMYDVDFDSIGQYCWTAQKGGYPIDYYAADDEEIIETMRRNCIGEE